MVNYNRSRKPQESDGCLFASGHSKVDGGHLLTLWFDRGTPLSFAIRGLCFHWIGNRLAVEVQYDCARNRLRSGIGLDTTGHGYASTRTSLRWE